MTLTMVWNMGAGTSHPLPNRTIRIILDGLVDMYNGVLDDGSAGAIVAGAYMLPEESGGLALGMGGRFILADGPGNGGSGNAWEIFLSMGIGF